MENYLEIKNIYKSFGSQKVLRGISLNVGEGEFVSILGASGSGKTTILRIIAGLEQPDSGTVTLAGRDITNLPPEKRQIGMIFQNYALFEHMTVEENIGYSLKLRRVPKKEIHNRVNSMLETVGLPGINDRMPDMLSGGQRQRVAVARSLIAQPGVLLLDEPLSALDAALRRRMRGELRELQQSLGMTFVLITHDEEEALTMSDRIALMDDGVFTDTGTPDEVKEKINL